MKEMDTVESGRPSDGLWVFGYGSLMWNPGFPFDRRADAWLRGRHRRLCVVSRHHRGDDRQPGLVMGLDRGGSCRGVAYRVPADAAAQTLEYLDEREIAHYPVYRRAILPISLGAAAAASRVQAVTYVVDRSDPDYAGHLSVAQQAAIVAVARGRSGDNRDYLASTVRHLHGLGLRNPTLEAVLHALGEAI